jgi:hypothetical protein
MVFLRLKNFFSVHKLAGILVVGIAVRLILMPISAHPFDMYVWYTLAQNILHTGPLTTVGFPPLWYHYMMTPIAYAYSDLSQILPTGTIALSTLSADLNFYPNYSVTAVPGLLFNFVVKVPFLISDVLLALLLYKLVGEATGKTHLGMAAAALWFLNPFVIWISAGWGMWDTLPALFSLATLFFLHKQRWGLAAVSLSLAVALKLYPALFLVPIAIYLYKAVPETERWMRIRSFFGVFLAASLLLFLPYLGAASSFLSDFFMLSGGGAACSVTPLGPYSFGLTYWSLSWGLLGASTHAASLVSTVSLILLVTSMLLVYWHANKTQFTQPLLSLSLVLFFCVAAFFLSYRIVSEQWIVWILPFLIVLCTLGRVKSVFYWGLSALALGYALLNCPLPFFFLPLSPWISDALVGMVHFVWWIEPLRVGCLAVLGVVFSVSLLFVVFRLSKAESI